MRYLGHKTCQTCGIVFEQSYTRSKKHWLTARFCSFKCRRHTKEVLNKLSQSQKASPSMRRGPAHHAWKGGIVAEHNKARGSAAYVRWRNAVYKKDRWTCQECDVHCEAGNIIAHHLVSFADRPDLRYLVENGEVLCRPCHARLHYKEREIDRAGRLAAILKQKPDNVIPFRSVA